MNDQELMRLYERLLTARSEQPRDRCASPDALLALARRAGPEEARLATLDHAMACRSCVAELDLLRAVEIAGAELAGADAGRARGAPPMPLRPRRAGAWRRAAPLALAASFAAAGLALLVGRSRVEPPEVTRGAADAIALERPGAEVAPRGPIEFAWRAVPGARGYVVELLDGAGRVVWSARTTDTTASLADARLVAPGAQYRWWVRVADGAWDHRASAVRPLRVRRE